MPLFDVLNEDFTTYTAFEPFLKKGVKGREIPSGSVLQVQQVSNISVPKESEGGQSYEPERHILRLSLTDGDATVSAIATEPIPRLNINTPPGTKVEFTHNVPLHGNLMILQKGNTKVLGGEVSKLIEKWNFQRSMDMKKEWGAVGRGEREGSEGPPLWRPVGQKAVPIDVSVLRKMKAMDIVNEKRETEAGQTQFDQQRNEAISELMEKGTKQWQKPNKHLVDKDVQDIMDEGFTFDEASNALSRFKNKQKALKFLKVGKGEFPQAKPGVVVEEKRDKRRKGAKGFQDEEEDNAPVPKEYQRPTNNISLFGFIAESIPVKDDQTSSSSTTQNNSYSEGHDNFRSDRGRSRGRGGFGRGGHRGRGDYRPYESNTNSSYNSRPNAREDYGRSQYQDRRNYPREEPPPPRDNYHYARSGPPDPERGNASGRGYPRNMVFSRSSYGGGRGGRGYS